MCPEPLALAKEEKLPKAHVTDPIRELAPRPVQRHWLAANQLCRPLEVIRTIESGL
jgi:hypothetical protein